MKKKTNEPTGKVHRRETKLLVRVGLDPEAREPLTKELLAALKEVEQLTQDKKDTVKTFNDQITEQEKKIEGLRADLEKGREELRDVIEVKDFPNGLVKYQDPQTKKYLKDHERQMTDADRQMVIGEEAGTAPDPENPEGSDQR